MYFVDHHLTSYIACCLLQPGPLIVLRPPERGVIEICVLILSFSAET
jgi:hypothetical protein